MTDLNHDLWNLSENLRATAAVLSHLIIRADSYTGHYTDGLDAAFQIEGLLANIESLIKAANAVQYISQPITRDVLIASVNLKKRMRQYKRDLESCSDDDIGIRRPRNVYDRTIPRVLDIAHRYYKILNDLKIRVEAESLMPVKKDESKAKEKTKVRKRPDGRKKTPPQLLKAAREIQAVKELLKNRKIKTKELGEILDCSKSTVCRLMAWKNRNVSGYKLPPRGHKITRENGKPDIEAIDESQ